MAIPDSIAIIPARGGSRRISRKNVIDFLGKPLIAWSIEAAIRSNCFGQVLVSTDDPEIAEVAKAFGAIVPFMRQHTGDDLSPSSLATIEALDQYRDWHGSEPPVVAQLLPTCPLRSAETIQRSIASFESCASDFQLSCMDFGPFNPWWAVRLGAAGHPTPLFPEAFRSRSQDLEKLYAPTGAIWIARVQALRAAQSFYGPNHVLWPVDWRTGLDIDTYDDLELARTLATLPDGAN